MRNPPPTDVAFEQWQAEYLGKYPEILNAYTYLSKCWKDYHPKTETK